VSGGIELSQQEREEVYEAMMELASIVNPPPPYPMPNNPDDLVAALDFATGTDAGKTVADRWSCESDAAFRKIVERNRTRCNELIEIHGQEKCRDFIVRYRDFVEALLASANPGLRREALAALLKGAMMGFL
jgi:hypothetical protein